MDDGILVLLFWMNHVSEFSNQIGSGECERTIDFLYFGNGFLIVFE